MKRPFFVVLSRKKAARIPVILLLLALTWKLGLTGISQVCFGSTASLKGRKIVVDPGHGGIDGGTNCSDFLEKEVNLAVAKKLQAELAKYGARVILTRDRDVTLGQRESFGASNYSHRRALHERVTIIEKNRPDVFISIHVNANQRRPSTSGSIVFYNQSVKNADKLAKALQHHLNEVTGKYQARAHVSQAAAFYILKNTISVGAVIELGFMTNYREKELLKQDRYQLELARAIVAGLQEYFSTKG